MRHRPPLATALLGLALAGLPVEAAYPERPVRVIVHTQAGGGTDTLARVLFRHAGELSGTTFVVENHPGAGGQIGYTRLATAEPDGYTLGAITTMSILTHELTRPDVFYRLRSTFLPLARIVLDPSVLVVRDDSPFRSLDDVIRAAHRKPRSLTWGGTTLWGAHHIHYELLRRATGAELVYVPFDGAAEARAALLGGHVDVGAGGFTEYASLVRAGQLRFLAIGAAEHWALFQEAPTYRDLGYDIVVGSDRGFAVPAGTPPDRMRFLTTAIRQALESPGFAAAAESAGIAPSLAPLFGPDYAGYLLQMQNDVRPLVESAMEDSAPDSVLASPWFFPTTVGLLLLVLSAAGLTRRMREPHPTPPSPDGRVALKLTAFAAIVVGFSLLLPLAGFAMGGTALMAAAMLLLGGRRAVHHLLLAVLVPLALILIFHYGLGVRLPASAWH